MKKVTIYTDGGCKPNPGEGGWAAILLFEDHEKEISGAAPKTTNHRMEISAALEAMRALKDPHKITLHTDSAYLANAFNHGWLKGWLANGWKTSIGKPVKNTDLWKQLHMETRRHQVRWMKVRGHSTDALNNRVDALATRARQALHNST